MQIFMRRSLDLKATGIVRRIDDLGRIVIPKEIRRTLKIREGDPLEIYTDSEGEVILKKYSHIGGLDELASDYAESLSKTSNYIICISDKDSIIATSGTSKKEFLNKPLSPELNKIIDDRDLVIIGSDNSKLVSIAKDVHIVDNYHSQIISPIIADGDPIGAVILLSNNKSHQLSENDSVLAKTASSFLAKQIEQ